MLSGLESAVELRLGEKRAGKLENLAGLAQLLDLALQFFDALLVRADAPRSIASAACNQSWRRWIQRLEILDFIPSYC